MWKDRGGEGGAPPMTTATKNAASEFLASRRIAVTGVSHAPKGHGSNAVYTWLRDKGYEVFAVNPSVGEVEGDHSYPDLHAIPGGVEAVVIATAPQLSLIHISEPTRRTPI